MTEVHKFVMLVNPEREIGPLRVVTTGNILLPSSQRSPEAENREEPTSDVASNMQTGSKLKPLWRRTGSPGCVDRAVDKHVTLSVEVKLLVGKCKCGNA